MDTTNVYRLTIPADLCESSMEQALAMGFEREPTLLIVSPDDALIAGRLAQRYGCGVLILPLLADSAWAVRFNHEVVISEGAG